MAPGNVTRFAVEVIDQSDPGGVPFFWATIRDAVGNFVEAAGGESPLSALRTAAVRANSREDRPTTRESGGYKEFASGDKVIVSFRTPGTDEIQIEVEGEVVHSPSAQWLTWDAIDVLITSGPDPTEGYVGKGMTVPVLSKIVRKKES